MVLQPFVSNAGTSQSPNDADLVITLVPGRVLKVMLGIIALLAIAGTVSETFKSVFQHDYVYGLVPLFNLDREANIPTYYSALALLTAAVTAFLIGRIESLDRVRWKFLALLLLYVSIDEASHIHEMLNEPVQMLFNTKGAFFYGWVLVAIPVALILAATYIPFVLRLPRRIAGLFVGSVALVIGGAVVLEMVGAPWAETYGVNYVPYRFLTVVEEILEMVGVAIFNYALLTHLHSLLVASGRRGFLLAVKE